MAMAMTSCVSLLIAPKLIPPVQNLSTSFDAGSTSSMEIGLRSLLISSISRRVVSRKALCSFSHNRGLCTKTTVNEVVVHCSSSKKDWHVRLIGTQLPLWFVTQYNHLATIADSSFNL